jgi:DNA (cytosine-5)-methyltransferase 1
VKVRFADIFAGIGGCRLAAENVGWKCVFSSESDAFARLTYSANLSDCEIHGDITKIPVEIIPPFEVLLAGMPCQAFSKAGRQEGFGDERGTLFFQIARIIKYHQPEVVLLENVPNLAAHDEGRTFNVISKTLNNLGYDARHEVLDARDFGLPQKRRRIFIVGLRNRSREIDPFARFSFPIPPKTPTRVGDILESDVDCGYTITDRRWTGFQERKQRNMQAGKGFGFSLVNANSAYTNTISARYFKDGSEILIEKPGGNPRILIPREAARLQGFPDTFYIPVSDAQAYKGFGNSVPVPVVKAIALEIDRYLNQKSTQRISRRKEIGIPESNEPERSPIHQRL